MKKKTLLCTTIASTMFIAGLAMPGVNAAAENVQGKISVNIPAKGEHSVVLELMNGNTKLTKADVEEIVNAKYKAKNMAERFVDVAPVNADGTVGTGAKVTLTTGAELTVVLYGDVNGDGQITVETDAQRIVEYSLGLATLTPAQKLAADVILAQDTGDIYDAQRVFEYAFYNKDYTTKYNKEEYAEKFEKIEEKLPEELAPEVENFEVDSKDTGKITIKLSKAITPATDARFHLNGKLVTGVVDSEDSTKYTITLAEGDLKENQENTLEVSDVNNKFAETKTFTYRVLKAPTKITIAAKETVNDEGCVNANNVKSATVLVQLAQNSVPATLEVTIEDTPEEGEEATTITLKEEQVAGDQTEVRFAPKDLSSLREGKLTLTAKLKDDQGNVITTENNAVNKMSEAPVVKYSSVKRDNAEQVTIETLKSSATDVLYYLIQKDGEAPSVDTVISTGTKVESGTQIVAQLENGQETESYVVYIVAQTVAGTKSTDVLKVNVPKTNATKLTTPIASTIEKKTSTEATYVWQYDDETPGLIGYKAILQKKGGKDTAYQSAFKDFREQTIQKGEPKEVNFFDDMKEEGAKYKIIIIALADNVDYADSDRAEFSQEIEVKEVADTITLSFDDTNKTLLKWGATAVNPTEVADYTLEVAKYSKSANKYQVVSTINNILADSYDIKSTVEKYGLGVYAFRVIANAKSDILKVNKASAENFDSPTDRYYQLEGIKDLGVTDVTGTTLKLTGTLDDIYPSEVSSDLEYQVWTKDGDGEYVNTTKTVDKFPFEVTDASLVAGHTYKIKVVTNVKGSNAHSAKTDYISNEVTVTMKKDINYESPLTYKKYEAKDALNVTANLTSDNTITYKDDTLYIRGTTNVDTYTSESNEAVANIIGLLKQMDAHDGTTVTDESKITITTNEVTALTIVNKNSNSSREYDLSAVKDTATVTVTGNATYPTVLKGSIATLTLDGTTPKFNLLGLTVSGNVTVNNAEKTALEISENTKLVFTTTKESTVNGVAFKALDSDTTLPNITKTTNGFKVTEAKKLEVNSSELKEAVELNITNTEAIEQIDILANKDNITKLVADSATTVTALNILGGKVDILDADITGTTITAKGTEVGESEKVVPDIIIVTDKVASADKKNEKFDNTSATKVIENSKFEFAPSNKDTISYSLKANSNEVTLTIPKDGTVTITKS